ncbi:MAG TPA: YetF domain-containing protein [Gammaproteobacteria bacterium]|nr:YetF domain-containing protein [Gammaproteobacteria bacterium]
MGITSDILHFLSNVNSGTEIPFVLLRTCIIYIYSVFLVRFSVRYQLQTALDFVLIFTIGAILGGAIYGASLLSMFGASFVLVMVHKLLAFLSFHSRFWGKFMKGKHHILFVNGHFNRKMMCRLQITKDDIMEECRKQLQTESLNSVRQIRMERTGHISFIRKK